MFKIIGADGKEYGPISAEVLQKWIAEGRANAQSKVRYENSAEWRTVAEFPELVAVMPGVIVPPLPASSAAGAGTAATQVAGPAIGLIITAVLGFLASIAGTLWNLLAAGASLHQPGMSPEAERIITMFSGTIGVVSGILGFIASGLILFGALKMQKLRSYGWAMTASILAILPCVSPCCLVGLPIGIWALVILSKPEVKAQFT